MIHVPRCPLCGKKLPTRQRRVKERITGRMLSLQSLDKRKIDYYNGKQCHTACIPFKVGDSVYYSQHPGIIWTVEKVYNGGTVYTIGRSQMFCDMVPRQMLTAAVVKKPRDIGGKDIS
jgi:hypothetical protein